MLYEVITGSSTPSSSFGPSTAPPRITGTSGANGRDSPGSRLPRRKRWLATQRAEALAGAPRAPAGGGPGLGRAGDGRRVITSYSIHYTKLYDICDRAYIIKDGQIVKQGPPETIALDPQVREIYLGA